MTLLQHSPPNFVFFSREIAYCICKITVCQENPCRTHRFSPTIVCSNNSFTLIIENNTKYYQEIKYCFTLTSSMYLVMYTGQDGSKVRVNREWGFVQQTAFFIYRFSFFFSPFDSKLFKKKFLLFHSWKVFSLCHTVKFGCSKTNTVKDKFRHFFPFFFTVFTYMISQWHSMIF